jgi:hypothetical protein
LKRKSRSPIATRLIRVERGRRRGNFARFNVSLRESHIFRTQNNEARRGENRQKDNEQIRLRGVERLLKRLLNGLELLDGAPNLITSLLNNLSLPSSTTSCKNCGCCLATRNKRPPLAIFLAAKQRTKECGPDC